MEWLPPHDSNVPSSVNSGAPSPRWLDGNERWWSNGESNSGRRSCKDQLQPAACPEMVPSARFELASCALQARAITRFANWAKLARTSVIETDSPEWHSGARPSSYVRNDAWWVTLESNQAGTKAQALQARSVPRLGVTRIGWNARFERASNGAEAANSSAAPAYVRPGAIVHGGEPRT